MSLTTGKLYRNSAGAVFTVLKPSKIAGKFVVEFENGDVAAVDPTTDSPVRYEYPVTVQGWVNVYPGRFGRDTSSEAYVNGFYKTREAAVEDADEKSVLGTVNATIVYEPIIKD